MASNLIDFDEFARRVRDAKIIVNADQIGSDMVTGYERIAANGLSAANDNVGPYDQPASGAIQLEDRLEAIAMDIPSHRAWQSDWDA
jgi:hypothetical protein